MIPSGEVREEVTEEMAFELSFEGCMAVVPGEKAEVCVFLRLEGEVQMLSALPSLRI